MSNQVSQLTAEQKYQALDLMVVGWDSSEEAGGKEFDSSMDEANYIVSYYRAMYELKDDLEGTVPASSESIEFVINNIIPDLPMNTSWLSVLTAEHIKLLEQNKPSELTGLVNSRGEEMDNIFDDADQWYVPVEERAADLLELFSGYIDDEN